MRFYSLLLPLLSFILAFAVWQQSACAQTVTFDLDKGSFNPPNLPYIQPLTITGKATWNGKPVDGLQLNIKQLFSSEIARLKQSKFDVLQLSASIRSDSGKVLQLHSIQKVVADAVKRGGNIDKLTIDASLTSLGYSDLAKVLDAETPSGTNKKFDEAISKSIATLDNNLTENRASRTEIQSKVDGLEKTVASVNFYDGIWIRTGTETEFSFSVGQLTMSEDYSFSFAIFQKNTSAFPVDKLLTQLLNHVDSMMVDLSTYTVDRIKIDAKKAVDQIQGELFPGVYSLDVTGKLAVKGLALGTERIDRIVDLFKQYHTKIAGAIGSKDGAQKIEKNLTVSIKASAAYGRLTASQGDALLKLVTDPASYDLAKFDAAIAAFPELKALHNQFVNMKESRDDIVTNSSEAVAARASIVDEFEFIKNLYNQTGNVTKSGSSLAGAATDIDGIRLGTVYGIGVVPLTNNSRYVEWFLFVGVNIRWDDFDNRLPGKKAYKSGLSRWSAMVGIATGTQMEYRGQKLNDTRLGFKPVIGVNWEPIQHLNLGLGIISFIPETAGNSQNETKVRPYASLSFDFNLFNYLIQKKD